MSVVFYTIGCQKCNVLKLKMEAAGIKFETIDDEDAVVKKAVELGYNDGAPFIIVDGTVMNFNSAMKWVYEYVKSQKGN